MVIWSFTVPMAAFVTAAVAMSGATLRSGRPTRKKIHCYACGFFVGFSLISCWLFFFSLMKMKGAVGIQRTKSRFMKFVNLYWLSRLIVPSFQVYMTLFGCSALSLAFFFSRLHARQKARIILNNLEKYPIKMQAKLPGCREGGRGDRNCSRRYR